MEIRRQLQGINFLFLTCRSQGPNSGCHQSREQLLLCTDPSHWPTQFFGFFCFLNLKRWERPPRCWGCGSVTECRSSVHKAYMCKHEHKISKPGMFNVSDHSLTGLLSLSFLLLQPKLCWWPHPSPTSTDQDTVQRASTRCPRCLWGLGGSWGLLISTLTLILQSPALGGVRLCLPPILAQDLGKLGLKAS